MALITQWLVWLFKRILEKVILILLLFEDCVTRWHLDSWIALAEFLSAVGADTFDIAF